MKKLCFIFLLFTNFCLPADKKLKIGLCVTATNKYIKFVTPLLRTARILFLKDHEVHFFIFTDQKFNFDPRTNVIKVPHTPWPFSTMMRFAFYLENREALNDMDYLYACDADMLFMAKVSEEIISERVGVLHPFFWNDQEKGKLQYDKNPISKAFVNDNEGSHYFAGGFYGGKKEEFFKLLETVVNNIYQDLKLNYVAKWHDESHLNRYFIDNPPTKVLESSYCYPQFFFNHPQKDFNFKRILVALNKNHHEFQN